MITVGCPFCGLFYRIQPIEPLYVSGENPNYYHIFTPMCPHCKRMPIMEVSIKLVHPSEAEASR